VALPVPVADQICGRFNSRAFCVSSIQSRL
jgi:hypothetical protein